MIDLFETSLCYTRVCQLIVKGRFKRNDKNERFERDYSIFPIITSKIN